MTESSSPTLASPSYGTDEQGLICGYWFQAQGPVVTLADAASALALLASDQAGFLWLHFNLSHAHAEPWLRSAAKLGENFFEALHDGSRSTRIERDAEALFAVINDVTFDFSLDAGDVSTLWVNVTERLVVTARRQPLRSIDRLRMSVKRGEVLGSSVALLNHLLGDQADELQRIVRMAAERVDDVEDAVLAGQHERHTAELARLRRLMVRLQRLLAPEPSALLRTLSNPPTWVQADDRQRMHHASEEFALVLRDITALQERIKLMQDEAATRVAEENNRSLFMLTMVTVLALPINLISGLFGMNVGGTPMGSHPAGFWIVVGCITTLTVVIGVLTVRRVRSRR